MSYILKINVLLENIKFIHHFSSLKVIVKLMSNLVLLKSGKGIGHGPGLLIVLSDFKELTHIELVCTYILI